MYLIILTTDQPMLLQNLSTLSWKALGHKCVGGQTCQSSCIVRSRYLVRRGWLSTDNLAWVKTSNPIDIHIFVNELQYDVLEIAMEYANLEFGFKTLDVFLKSSRPSFLIKRAALGNLKTSFHCTHWHRFFPLKKDPPLISVFFNGLYTPFGSLF